MFEERRLPHTGAVVQLDHTTRAFRISAKTQPELGTLKNGTTHARSFECKDIGFLK